MWQDGCLSITEPSMWHGVVMTTLKATHFLTKCDIDAWDTVRAADGNTSARDSEPGQCAGPGNGLQHKALLSLHHGVLLVKPVLRTLYTAEQHLVLLACRVQHDIGEVLFKHLQAPGQMPICGSPASNCICKRKRPVQLPTCSNTRKYWCSLDTAMREAFAPSNEVVASRMDSMVVSQWLQMLYKVVKCRSATS